MQFSPVSPLFKNIKKYRLQPLYSRFEFQKKTAIFYRFITALAKKLALFAALLPLWKEKSAIFCLFTACLKRKSA